MKNKKIPGWIHIPTSDLSSKAREELSLLQKRLGEAGYGALFTQAVRVALDQWARECGGDSEIKAGKAAS